MGFKQPGDARSIIAQLQSLEINARSPYNDGWTASACKYELYLVKCYLDDMYKRLPTFADEAQWEQERIVDILKK